MLTIQCHFKNITLVGLYQEKVHQLCFMSCGTNNDDSAIAVIQFVLKKLKIDSLKLKLIQMVYVSFLNPTIENILKAVVGN